MTDGPLVFLGVLLFKMRWVIDIDAFPLIDKRLVSMTVKDGDDVAVLEKFVIAGAPFLSPPTEAVALVETKMVHQNQGLAGLGVLGQHFLQKFHAVFRVIRMGR